MNEEANEVVSLDALIELVTKAYNERQITQSIRSGSDGTVEGFLHIPTGAATVGDVSDAYRNVLGMVGAVHI